MPALTIRLFVVLGMKMRFIVNVRSGGATRALAAVREFAAKHGAVVALTERARHGADLAAQALAQGCDLVVAVGGDGTMNEVASALVDTGATLGLVPCGSGDGLGRHLGIHGTVDHALEILRTGQPRAIDCGTADGHPFFTAAGIGFEAEIAQRFNRLTKRGFARYLSTSWSLWREWPAQRYVITDAAGSTSFDAFTLAVANANQYGNDAYIAPDARVDDGLLNLTAIPPIGFWDGAVRLRQLFSGRITHAPGVLSRVGAAFTIERDEPGPLHTDGELHDAGRTIEFRVRSGCLRVIAPPVAA